MDTWSTRLGSTQLINKGGLQETLNICFVSPEYYPISGGTGAYVNYLSRELQKRGHSVHVITRSSEKAARTVEEDTTTYIRCAGNPLRKFIGFARSTSKKLIELNNISPFDVVHANLPLVPSFALPEELKTALVCTVHSTWKGEAEAIKSEGFRKLNLNEKFMLEFNAFLRSSEKKLMHRADALIAVSQYTKKELTEFYSISEERIHVIYNGVHVEKFKPSIRSKADLRRELGLATDRRIILFVGRLYSRKGLPTLLQAAQKVVKDSKNTQFVISGEGFKQNEEKLRKLTRQYGIEDNVSFIGYFPDEKLPNLYAAADIFVLPALYENFPFAILEAQSTGLPVVSTRVGGIPELIIDNHTGLLVDPGDHEQLADAIMKLLQDSSFAQELGRKARQVIEEKFALPLVTSQVVDLYQKVAQKK
jgi:glycosyltransferase involved in cell wall biosynthesis